MSSLGNRKPLIAFMSTCPLRYYGKQILDPHPPYSICLAQAVLTRGVDPMFCTAALALILEILLQTGTIIWPRRYKIRVGMVCVRFDKLGPHELRKI